MRGNPLTNDNIKLGNLGENFVRALLGQDAITLEQTRTPKSYDLKYHAFTIEVKTAMLRCDSRGAPRWDFRVENHADFLIFLCLQRIEDKIRVVRSALLHAPFQQKYYSIYVYHRLWSRKIREVKGDGAVRQLEALCG